MRKGGRWQLFNPTLSAKPLKVGVRLGSEPLYDWVFASTVERLRVDVGESPRALSSGQREAA